MACNYQKTRLQHVQTNTLPHLLCLFWVLNIHFFFPQLFIITRSFNTKICTTLLIPFHKTEELSNFSKMCLFLEPSDFNKVRKKQLSAWHNQIQTKCINYYGSRALKQQKKKWTTIWIKLNHHKFWKTFKALSCYCRSSFLQLCSCATTITLAIMTYLNAFHIKMKVASMSETLFFLCD